MRVFPARSLLIVAAFILSSHANAVEIFVQPDSQPVFLGTPVEIAISVSGLGVGGPPSLGAFDLDLEFDPTVLSFSSADFGDPVLGDQLDLFGLGSIFAAADLGGGAVNLFQVSLDLPSDLNILQSDSFTLATLLFDPILVGTSEITLTVNGLADAEGAALTADVRNGTVGAVPEPSTWLLFGAGLVLLFRRRIGRYAALAVLLGTGWVGAVEAQISDTKAPTLVEFSFSPATVNAVGGPGMTSVTARVADDLSGVSAVWVDFTSPTFQYQNAYLPRVSGDEFDGIYAGTVTIPEFSEGGTWKASVSLYDFVGNGAYIDQAALAGLGFPTDLAVTSVQDINPPTLNSVSFSPASINVSGGEQTVMITLNVSDDVSGIDLADPNQFDFSVRLVSPDAMQSQYVHNHQFSLIAGDVMAGIWEAPISLPQFSDAGIWSIDYVSLRDRVENRLYLSNSQLQMMGLATTLDILSSPEDTTPPTLADLTFTPAFINTSTGPENVVVQYTLTDDRSGVAFLPDTPDSSFSRGASFLSPSGQQYHVRYPFGDAFTLTSGTPLNGVWESTIYFPQFSEDGDWRISDFWVQDAVRNDLRLTTADLDAMGVPRLVVIRPSLDSDGIINPVLGGTVQDDTFGDRASISVDPGILTNSTDVAIDVFEDPLAIPTPVGFAAPGTLFVNIDLSPEPAFPLPAPGLTVILPVEDPLPPGSALSLFKVDPPSGLLVPAIGVSGLPVVGTVDAGGVSATFTGIASLSTVVGLIEATPCDVDNSGEIDLFDIKAITQSRNTSTEAGDPRDVDGDGIVTILDARQCVLACTNPRCSPN